MVTRTPASDFNIEAVRRAAFMSYVLIFSILLGSVALRKEAFLAMWTLPRTVMALPSFLARLLLFVVTLALIIRWIAATAHEFNLWVEHLEYIFIRAQVYAAMVGLAFGLGLMLVLVYDVTIFAGYFTAFMLFSLWTGWLAIDHFRRALSKTERNAQNRAILDIFESYWLKRPQLSRVGVLIMAALSAFVVALTGTIWGNEWAEFLQLLAEGILILTIVWGELVISRWRKVRDRQLQAIIDAPSRAVPPSTAPRPGKKKKP